MTLGQVIPTDQPRALPVPAALSSIWHALEMRLGAVAPTLFVFGPVALLVHFLGEALPARS